MRLRRDLKSPLRKYLRHNLGTEIRIRKILWTGANTTKARQEGVEKLASQPRKSLTENPSNQHGLLGSTHSYVRSLALSFLQIANSYRKVFWLLDTNKMPIESTAHICHGSRNGQVT